MLQVNRSDDLRSLTGFQWYLGFHEMSGNDMQTINAHSRYNGFVCAAIRFPTKSISPNPENERVIPSQAE